MSIVPRLISAALIAGVGMAATAQETATFSSHRIDDVSSTVVPSSGRSRAEVQAETLAAMHAGKLSQGESSYTVVTPTGSTLTRAQVTAEAREAMRLGLYHWNEASSGGVTPAQAEQIRQAGLRAVAADFHSASR